MRCEVGRTFRVVAAIAVASVAVQQDGHAQADSARKDSAAAGKVACDTVLRAARVDSVETEVRAYLLRIDGALPEKTRSLLMQMLLGSLQVPRPLQLPVFAAGPARLRMLRPERLEGDSASPRAPLLYGVYAFRLRRSGGVDSVHVEIPALAPGVDSAIVHAVRAGAADSAMTEVFKALRKDVAHFQLRLTSGAPDGRLRTPSQTIFTGTFPRIRMRDAHADDDNLPPEYPLLERVSGGDGEVLVRVVIDVDGRASMPTAEVLHSTSPLFSLSALQALGRFRFQPARVGPCAVPQVLEIPFWFSLRP